MLKCNIPFRQVIIVLSQLNKPTTLVHISAFTNTKLPPLCIYQPLAILTYHPCAYISIYQYFKRRTGLESSHLIGATQTCSRCLIYTRNLLKENFRVLYPPLLNLELFYLVKDNDHVHTVLPQLTYALWHSNIPPINLMDPISQCANLFF